MEGAGDRGEESGRAMEQQQERVSRIVREYDGQGWHRTGSDVDRGSAEWLADLVRGHGLEPTLQPVTLERIEPRAGYVEIDGRRVDGLPVFDGGFTGPEGVVGRLGPLGSDAEIGLARVEVVGGSDEYGRVRRNGPHGGLVAVTVGGEPGLAPGNAPDFLAPFGPPAVQVGSDVWDWLSGHADRRSMARVVADVESIPATAFNVVVETRGRNDGLTPLAVMTPRSGWWACAAERAGGIACWLEVLGRLGEANAMRNVIFVATTGHELGHLGLETFLASRPGLATGAVSWIHLGSSIGAAREPRLLIYTSDDELERLALETMSAAGAATPPVAPRGAAGGESRNIADRGGRYLSIAGGHATFHLEADRWPSAVDVPSLAAYAHAVVQMAETLANSPSDAPL